MTEPSPPEGSASGAAPQPFDRLPLDLKLLRAVADSGYTAMTPIQAKAIPVVLAGRDVMGALAAQGYLGAALAMPATGYAAVYIVEIALLLATVLALRALSGERLPPATWPALQPSKVVE